MKSKGSVLIAVIWMVATLGVFVIALNSRVSQELLLGSWVRDRVAHRILARAGVERALFEFQQDAFLNFDALNEKWASNEEAFKDIKLLGGTFSVMCREDDNPASRGYDVFRYGACDESGLVNINFADEEILKNLYLILEDNDETEAIQFAHAVLDWRDEDDESMVAGAERNYYKALRSPYEPRNGKFGSVEEIQMVRGVSTGFYQKMRPHITVHTDGKVNFNTASQTAMQILGLDETLAMKVIEFRQGNDGIVGSEDDGIFEEVSVISSSLSKAVSFSSEEFAQITRLNDKELLSVKSEVFRIRSIGRLSNSDSDVPNGILCVIKRDGTILHWQEGIV